MLGPHEEVLFSLLIVHDYWDDDWYLLVLNSSRQWFHSWCLARVVPRKDTTRMLDVWTLWYGYIYIYFLSFWSEPVTTDLVVSYFFQELPLQLSIRSVSWLGKGPCCRWPDSLDGHTAWRQASSEPALYCGWGPTNRTVRRLKSRTPWLGVHTWIYLTDFWTPASVYSNANPHHFYGSRVTVYILSPLSQSVLASQLMSCSQTD